MADVAPNLVIVTLGVRDLDRSIAFYEGLGWERRGDRGQGIVWFRTSGPWLGLFPADELAADADVQVEPLPPFRGMTLAVNLPDVDQVDGAVRLVQAQGGMVVKPAAHTPWGGYSGYVADPDGHLWELCFNPGFPLDEAGRIEIP